MSWTTDSVSVSLPSSLPDDCDGRSVPEEDAAELASDASDASEDSPVVSEQLDRKTLSAASSWRISRRTSTT